MTVYTASSWAKAFLAQLGMPTSAANISFVVAWEAAEGGNWHNHAYFNPLNTTQSWAGANSINSDGVKAYKNWNDGLAATVKTIRNGRYNGILSALSRSDANGAMRAVLNSPWGTQAFPRLGVHYPTDPSSDGVDRQPTTTHPLPSTSETDPFAGAVAPKTPTSSPIASPVAPGAEAAAAPTAGAPTPATTLPEAVDLTAPTEPDASALNIGGVEAAPGAGAAFAPTDLGDLQDLNHNIPLLSLDEFRSVFPDGSGVVASPRQLIEAGTRASGPRRSKIVSLALAHLGTPYVWGGTSTGGWDCSGFVLWVMKQVGISMPRISADQARSGTRMSISKLAPGDLVAWDNSSRNNGADHIAIYLGNGWIAEAPRPGVRTRRRRLGRNEGAWGIHLDL